jgi:hypothetical protein
MQAHIHHLRSVADSREARKQERHMSAGLHPDLNYRRHIRQKSSDVFGPPATEILQLQLSTCDFWARCVNMYLERTTNRIKNSVSLHFRCLPAIKGYMPKHVGCNLISLNDVARPTA